ncbi:mitochondrial ferric reductase [Andalucia godoyi]|uniref:Mitochondrial ferric reductase n=1 Tax=Andalucia godoyi TaxID=505711 RepID=A0A8K0F403_ANDGO|nr:mitochondrial ferric reductase [Andalucia godoyi]|eukprot:ANDGO_07315.mRNA.1 mitochondrial ferric reductase
MFLIPRKLYPLLRILHKPVSAVLPNLSLGDVLFLFVFIAVEYAVCASAIKKLDFGKSLGSAIQWNMAFLLLPVTKRVSPLLVIANIPFERAVRFHRWIAYVTIIITLLHFFFLVFNNNMADFSNIAGLISMSSFLAMFLTSLAVMRRRVYDSFMKIHYVLAPTAYVFAIIHQDASGLILRCIAPFLVFLADWISRFFLVVRRKATIISTNLVSREGEQRIVQWEIVVENVGHETFRTPGQYVYLYIPSLKWSQMHPFSIAYTRECNDEERLHSDISNGARSTRTVLGFFIRDLGSYTAEMTKLKVENPAERPRVWVDGPFGSCALDISAYKNFVMIAGGVGITSILNYWNVIVRTASRSTYTAIKLTENAVVDEDQATTTTQHSASLAAYWTVKACDVLFAISVLRKMQLPTLYLSEASDNKAPNPSFKITLHFTRLAGIRDDEVDELRRCISELTNIAVDVVFGTNRVAITELLAQAVVDGVAADCKKTARFAVLACGPESLMNHVRSASATLSGSAIPPFTSAVFDVHTETFEF